MKIFGSLFFVFFIASSFSLKAQNVSKIMLSLDTSSNTGKCPRVLKFNAMVISDRHPGFVSLQWQSGDGNFNRTNNLTLSGSGQDVTSYQWAIPGNYSGSLTVNTNDASHVESNPVDFVVKCK